MITLKKLSKLKERTRIRKAANLCREFSRAVSHGEEIDRVYVKGLLQLEPLLLSVSEQTRERLTSAADLIGYTEGKDLRVLLDDIHYLLLEEIGAAVADWDMVDEMTGELDRSARKTYPISVYLDRLRSPFNVGSVFRSADSFGVEQVCVGEGTASPEHPRAVRTARGCTDTVPWNSTTPMEFIAQNTDPIFALELGGTPIDEFRFPARGTVVIGSEELGVSPEMLRASEGSLGRVSIPLAGTKGSLNVSVAFGILMQHWFAALERD